MSVTRGRARPRAKPLVYQATNLINGKRYIGVTMESLGARRAKHFWSAINGKSSMPIARAIRKYGKDMFRFVMLKRLETYEMALAEEVRLVATLKPEYNVGAAGLDNSGWHHTPEQRRAISKRNLGRPGFWKGKKLPDHVRQMFVEKAADPEQKRKWSEWRKLGPLAGARKIVCVDDGIEYPSIRAAAKAYNLSEKAINNICHGVGRTTGGKSFKYADGSSPLPAARRGRYFNKAEVAAIRAAAAHGISRRQLAQGHGVHYATILRILKGHTWKGGAEDVCS